MDWRRYVRSRLPALNTSAEREAEVVEELAIQLAAIYDRARANGATESEARASADAEVPDWQALADTLGRIEQRYVPPVAAGAGTGGIMTGLVQDVRYAIRALKHAPGFAAVSILTLALGIAATTIVYSLIDAILVRPLPIEDPDRVVLARETVANGSEMPLSWPNFLDLKSRASSFEDLAAWRGFPPNLTGFDRPRRVMARQVTANLFRVLGVTPVLGRDLTEEDDRWGVERVCLVSYAFWQGELGGESSAIGRRIMLDEAPVTVVGVLPPDFTVARREDIFLPFGNYLQPNSFMLGRGNHFGLAAIGRIRPEVTVAEARAEVEAIAAQLAQEYPNTNSGNSAIVRPLFEVLVSQDRPMLLVLLGAVGAMLLIACVNLANLMQTRAAGRAQEMAVRRSLGAARWRLAWQMLTESVLLSAAGGLAGVALAFAGFEAVTALLADRPRIHTVAIDLRVMGMAAAVSIATGLLFGLVPAIYTATGRGSLLRTSRVTGAAHSSAATRRALLLAEVALAVVLVAGAGLMLRTVGNLLSVETGFDAAPVISAQFSLPSRYDAPKRTQFIDAVVDRLRAIPGVTHAGYTYSLPVAGSNWNSVFIIQGQPEPPRRNLPGAAWTPVTPGYFDTMGIRRLRGRGFEPLDAGELSLPVAIVNETFARRFFPDGDAVGAMVKQGFPESKAAWRQIVGVVNDVRVSGLDGDAMLQVYLPVAQVAQPAGAFVARAVGDPAVLARAVEAAVHELDANLPVYDIEPMDAVIGGSIAQQRLTMVLLVGFAGLALLMAAIGVFGVTAHTVSLRTHELGVRLALGAQPSSVLALVLRQELAVCVAGVAVGMGGALLLSSLLESLLFGVASRDALTLSAAAAVLLVVTTAACLIPAWRATHVDPVTALRLE